MEITLEGVAKCLGGGQFTSIAAALLSDEGLTKERFHEMLREISTDSTESVIDLMRMNSVGGLRSFGFIIQGGRKGRHLPYKILGFEEPQAKETMDEWSKEDREIYEHYFAGLPQYDLSTIEEWLEPAFRVTQEEVYIGHGDSTLTECNPVLESMSRNFENTLLNLSSYKIGHGAALYESSLWPGRAVIAQKNRNRPKFTIINYGLPLSSLYELATELGKISYGPIVIENVGKEELPDYRDAFGTKGDMANPEALYDCEKFVSDPASKFGRRSLSYIRKFDRENRWIETSECFGLLGDVVTIWKDTLENRHRRLPITRDYRAISSPGSRKRMFLGLRDDHPISAVVTDGYLNRFDYAAKIVEKSLSYSFQPGGRPGTAAWSLFRTCQSLLEHGVQWYNGGRIFGGEQGLAEHKQHLADEVIIQYDFDTGLRRKEH